MSEMVERVTRAMEAAELGFSIQLTRLVDGVSTYELNYSDRIGSFEFADIDGAHVHVEHRRAEVRARAAIKAMREPTISMVRCGARAMQGDDLQPTNGEVNAAWRAMINDALTEGDEK